MWIVRRLDFDLVLESDFNIMQRTVEDTYHYAVVS